MKPLYEKTKTTLFLMEQVIVITVFAICAAVCMYILTHSYFTAVYAVDTKNALLAAESAAECFKAYKGDIAATAENLNGYIAGDAVIVYYREDWQAGEFSNDSTAFIMRLDIVCDEGDLLFSDITVTSGNDALLTLSVAARRDA